MKTILFLLLLSGIPAILLGQVAPYPMQDESILYLQDGRVIHGILRGGAEADTLELFLAGGSFLRIARAQVDSVSLRKGRYRRFSRTKVPAGKGRVQFPSHGMYHRLEASFYLIRRWDQLFWDVVQPSGIVSYHTGIRLHKGVTVGGGIGFHSFRQGPMIPIFGEISGDILPGRNALIYAASLGFGWTPPGVIIGVWEGGLRGKLALGWHRHSRGPISCRFTVGYLLQQFSRENPWQPNPILDRPRVVSGWFNGLRMGMGIEFGGKP